MEHAEKVRILIVDDKPDKAMAIGAIVSELGDVVTVNSGKDALRCLMNQSFAVILLDVNMPVMDGFETAELVRKRETNQRTPIIFITSYYEADAHKSRAYTLGAVDYILAPVIPEVLKAKVAVFADLFRKTEEVKLRAEERLQLMEEQMARVSAEAARAAAEDGERRAAFLAEASRVLVSSLNYEDTLQRVTQLTVPELCDWCAVCIVKDGGDIQCLSVTHAEAQNPEGRDKNPLMDLCNELVKSALDTGKSALSSQLVERNLPQGFGHLKNAFNLTSAMVIPLRAREMDLGGLCFFSATPAHNFTLRDLSLAEDLGQRAANAIDHARLYHEAQLANRTKDDFLTVVSHELRTPLTPIICWSRMLLEQKLKVSDVLHGLEIIERNARIQAKLVEDLLDVSRITSGKLRLRVAQVELDSVTAASIESLQTAADAKHITIKSNYQPGSLTLSGDADRLQQICFNLLSNAIKFTPENGTVTVEVKREGNRVLLQVKDTGKGIDPKFLPFVFDRFRQADSSSTRAYGGLGIGLAIVKHLVELHGGTVSADSGGEGKGSTFKISFPALNVERRVGSDSAVIPQPPTDPRAARLHGLSVLIVDDEPDCRQVIALLFERNGAHVIEAASAREAMERLERTTPNLIISDIGMEGEDGYRLIRRIRGSGLAAANVPAIALTAYAREEDKAAALAAGFQVHMVKPIEQNALLACAFELSQLTPT